MAIIYFYWKSNNLQTYIGCTYIVTAPWSSTKYLYLQETASAMNLFHSYFVGQKLNDLGATTLSERGWTAEHQYRTHQEHLQ